MTSKEETRLSQYLCFVLRHEPQDCSLYVMPGGWVSVSQLVKNSDRGFTKEIIQQIVANDSKGRYSLRDNDRQIRANQGHSFAVDLQLEPMLPPKYLLHGTAWKNVGSIMEHGIKRGVRHHVHLTDCYETAKSVGARHGKPKVLFIHANAMRADGFTFYKSDNGVWLTEEVPVLYISVKAPSDFQDCIPENAYE